MQNFLLPEEVASLQAIRERLSTTRPSGRGADALIHDAVHDGLVVVIATGQGSMSTERTFADAGKSVRRAVMTA